MERSHLKLSSHSEPHPTPALCRPLYDSRPCKSMHRMRFSPVQNICFLLPLMPPPSDSLCIAHTVQCSGLHLCWNASSDDHAPLRVIAPNRRACPSVFPAILHSALDASSRLPTHFSRLWQTIERRTIVMTAFLRRGDSGAFDIPLRARVPLI